MKWKVVSSAGVCAVLVVAMSAAFHVSADDVFRQKIVAPIIFTESSPDTNPSGPGGVTIEFVSLGGPIQAKVGEFYSLDLETLVTVAGLPEAEEDELQFVAIGALPDGMAVASDGLLSGTPESATAAGGVDFQVRATIGDVSDTQDFTIVVANYDPGQMSFVTPGTYAFVVPAGVTNLDEVVLIGGGGNYSQTKGGAGGAYVLGEDIAVVPGQTIEVVVGAVGEASLFGTELSAGGGSSEGIGGTGEGGTVRPGGDGGEIRGAFGGGGGGAGTSASAGGSGAGILSEIQQVWYPGIPGVKYWTMTSSYFTKNTNMPKASASPAVGTTTSGSTSLSQEVGSTYYTLKTTWSPSSSGSCCWLVQTERKNYRLDKAPDGEGHYSDEEVVSNGAPAGNGGEAGLRGGGVGLDGAAGPYGAGAGHLPGQAATAGAVSIVWN